MMIRPAIPADLPAIAALHAANWQRDYAGLLPDAVLGTTTEAAMRRRWNTGALQGLLSVLVAVDGPGLVGFAAFDPADPSGVHVDALHVAEGRRGRGIGRSLLAAVATASPGRPVWLEVLEGNAAARAVYAAWGGLEGPIFDDVVLGAAVAARRVTWADSACLAAGGKGRPRT